MQPSSFDSKPKVLSMAVPQDNDSESYVRLRIGDQIKYLTLAPMTLDVDIITSSFPPDLFEHLPKFPSGDWTRAHIYRKSSFFGDCSRRLEQIQFYHWTYQNDPYWLLKTRQKMEAKKKCRRSLHVWLNNSQRKRGEGAHLGQFTIDKNCQW